MLWDCNLWQGEGCPLRSAAEPQENHFRLSRALLALCIVGLTPNNIAFMKKMFVSIVFYCLLHS